MATPILDTLNINLSLKIFDPVSSSSSDGKIFTSAMRTRYINNAHNELIRLLSTYYDKPSDIIPDYYNILELYYNDDLKLILDKPYIIKDLYYVDEYSKMLKPIQRLEVTSYHPKKAEVNAMQSPEDEQRYWTLIDSEILLLPSEKVLYGSQGFHALVEKYFSEYELGGSIDITLPQNLHAILLSIAAAEASLDRGRWQFYNAYVKHYMTNIQLFVDRLKLKREVKR